MTVTNNLTHTIDTKTNSGDNMKIFIRLNETGKNGHEDFSITATVWEKGKPRNDRHMIAGGCCHEEILKARPDLKIFVNLHLCDADGVPMYAVANGIYHIKNGLPNQPKGSEEFKTWFCDAYRVTPEEFTALSNCRNEVQYATVLVTAKIFDRWKAEAARAIKQLEEWTGNKFESKATGGNYDAPTVEDIKREKERQETGYYTPEAEAARAEDQRKKFIANMEAELKKKIDNLTTEHNLKTQVFNAGGEIALNNFIFYTHTKEACFNWMNYNKLTPEEISNIINQMILPEGVTVTTKYK